MKKILIIFTIFISFFLMYELNLFGSQTELAINNSFERQISKEIYTREIDSDSSNRRYVLWRVYTQKPDTNVEIQVTKVSGKTTIYTYEYPDPNIGRDMIVDSVLRENFHTNKKWNIDAYYATKIKLKPDTYYLVLAEASCWDSAIKCIFYFYEEDCILHDNLENRKQLSEQWDKTKIVYNPINWKAMDSIKAEIRIKNFKKRERQVSYKNIFMKPGLIRTKNEIEEVLYAHSTELKHRYQKHLDSGHLFTGTLTLSLNIEANGNVSAVSTISSVLLDSINDPNFEDIIKKFISTWKFKKIEQGNVKVNITFVFD